MKILFLSGQYPPRVKGGGEVSTHLLARGLIEAGQEVTVLTEGQSESQVDGVRVVGSGVDMTGKVLLERQQAKALAKVVWREIEGGGYEVVHAHEWRSALALGELLLLAKKNNINLPRLVVTARDYAQISGSTNNIHSDGSLGEGSLKWRDIWQDHRIGEVGGFKKLLRLTQYGLNVGYRRRMFASLPAQVFISEAQRREVGKYQDLSGQKTTVIYNPVPEEYLHKRPVKGQMGNILYVGRVEMYKGVKLLLRAWREVAENFPEAHLTIVGEGAQQEEYQWLVERWGLQYRVSFKGFVPWERLMDTYDQAMAVVAPHIWVEPFGRTVAEAMARGKVLVAAERGGAAEMIESGRNGLLFAPGSVEALGKRLEEALSLPDLQRDMMGREARNWAREHLNSKQIAGEYLDFYQEISSHSTNKKPENLSE